MDTIIINSIDRQNGTTLSSAGYLLNKPFSGYFYVHYFSMYNTLFNINNFNNKIYFNDSVTNNIATLTNGYYYLDSNFITNITTAMNLVSTKTYTITINQFTNKLSYTQSSGNLSFTFGTNKSNSARYLLGFNNINTITPANILVSDAPVDLNPYREIYVIINENIRNSTIMTRHMLPSFLIHNNQSFGDIIRYYDNNNLSDYIVLSENIQLSISFRDQLNNVITINNDYTLILKKKEIIDSDKQWQKKIQSSSDELDNLLLNF